jgi:dihydroorotate dehydrogenase
MKIYVSPPFGNYLDLPRCYRIRGSFTLDKRPGLLSQVLKTFRKIEGGWVNNIGLRNKGIYNVDFNKQDWFSIAGIKNDWDILAEYIPAWVKLELNLSCPNVSSYSITDRQLKKFTEKYPDLIVKYPPSIIPNLVFDHYEIGVRHIHIANTLPSERGGISGRPLKPYNLSAVKSIAKIGLPELRIIGGGGIYTVQDAVDYVNAGASSISLSTGLFNPYQAYKIIKSISML